LDKSDTVRNDMRQLVERVHIVQSGVADHSDMRYAPRAEASLLVRWGGTETPVVSVIGPLTHARNKAFPTPRLMIQVFFRAGHARSFLGVPLHETADRIVAIDALWGAAGERLRDRLTSCSLESALSTLYLELQDRLDCSALPSYPPLISLAMDRLSATSSSVEKVAAALGVGDRRLRRLFNDELGMTPKHFVRISRLQRVLMTEQGSRSWAERAIDAGYYDQAHMIGDFRDLMNTTPAAFWARSDRLATPFP
jgi:AraC-like DNA-binding protein